jgi:hypothetical protein
MLLSTVDSLYSLSLVLLMFLRNWQLPTLGFTAENEGRAGSIRWATLERRFPNRPNYNWNHPKCVTRIFKGPHKSRDWFLILVVKLLNIMSRKCVLPWRADRRDKENRRVLASFVLSEWQFVAQRRITTDKGAVLTNCFRWKLTDGGPLSSRQFYYYYCVILSITPYLLPIHFLSVNNSFFYRKCVTIPEQRHFAKWIQWRKICSTERSPSGAVVNVDVVDWSAYAPAAFNSLWKEHLYTFVRRMDTP